MKKSPNSTYLKLILTLLFVVPAKAQNINTNLDDTCRGPVVSASEVSRRATITSKPIPTMTQEALEHDVRGRVVLEAILCRTGRVTDLRIVESLPYGMTEKSLEAVRQIQFIPAEMNWHTVSQKMRFEFHFNDWGLNEIAAKDCEGRRVDSVEVIGNRRLAANEIIGLIQTRPGDVCSVQQLKNDLTAILATGNFSSAGTGGKTVINAAGGVVVFIEVHELPLISEVRFEGLQGLPESVLFAALLKDESDLRPGRPYDPAKVRTAMTIIRKVMESSWKRDVEVVVRTEDLTASSVVLTFVVRAKGRP